jgi:hypothetical protein
VLITRHFAFAHVPKTGGIWFREIIKAHAPHDWRPLVDDRSGGAQHMKASDIRSRTHLPIVAVVRNPWSWWVSWFFFMKQKGKQHLSWQQRFADTDCDVPGFRVALDRMLADRQKCPQCDIVIGSRGPVVDSLVDFDSMREKIPSALKSLGVPSVDNVPWSTYPAKNTSLHQGYADYYTPELVDRVARLSAPLIDLMGFSFRQESR